MKHNQQHVNADSPIRLKTRYGKQVSIPFEGSLGLLALGDIGLVLWRNEKERHQSLTQKQS